MGLSGLCQALVAFIVLGPFPCRAPDTTCLGLPFLTCNWLFCNRRTTLTRGLVTVSQTPRGPAVPSRGRGYVIPGFLCSVPSGLCPDCHIQSGLNTQPQSELCARIKRVLGHPVSHVGRIPRVTQATTFIQNMCPFGLKAAAFSVNVGGGYLGHRAIGLGHKSRHRQPTQERE